MKITPSHVLQVQKLLRPGSKNHSALEITPRSTHQPTNQATHPPTNQPNPTNQTTHRPTDQPNQPITRQHTRVFSTRTRFFQSRPRRNRVELDFELREIPPVGLSMDFSALLVSRIGLSAKNQYGKTQEELQRSSWSRVVADFLKKRVFSKKSASSSVALDGLAASRRRCAATGWRHRYTRH